MKFITPDRQEIMQAMGLLHEDGWLLFTSGVVLPERQHLSNIYAEGQVKT